MITTFLELPAERWSHMADQLAREFTRWSSDRIIFDGLVPRDASIREDVLTFCFRLENESDAERLVMVSQDLGILKEARIYGISAGAGIKVFHKPPE